MNDVSELVRIDEKMRIVIPVEFRNWLGLEEGTFLKVDRVGDTIVLSTIALEDASQARAQADTDTSLRSWLEREESQPETESSTES